MNLTIRQATEADLDLIVQWRAAAARWLADRGSDQWSSAGLPGDVFRERVASSIQDGATWMAVDNDGQPVGTIAIDSWADAGLWTSDEVADAVIVHRMILAPGCGGRAIGTALLDHADQVAAECGRGHVRLDAWTSNIALHRYYQRQGFRHVRTVTGHDSPSSALFERPVRETAP